MLPKLCLVLGTDTVSLGEPLAQTQDSLVDMVLQFHRVVKGALGFEGVLICLGKGSAFEEPLEGATRLVIGFDFPGAGSDFAFEFLGGHEEVQEGDQGFVDGGQEGLFLKALEPVIAGVFTDDGAVFLFDEAVIVFVVVPGTGEGESLIFTPDFGGVVDKFGAVVAVELQNREGDGGFDIRESLEGPPLGVIEQGTEFDPS
jgi:hypothetical protein